MGSRRRQRREGSLPVRHSVYLRAYHRAEAAAADPRDPMSSKPTTDQIHTLENFRNIDLFAARGDPTSRSETRNKRQSTSYVGRAARPPRVRPNFHALICP